jgi:hypothetical protein
MFKWFLKRGNQTKAVAPVPALSRKSAIRSELAMRASIAKKLKNYNAAEDTTISNFTLPDDKGERKCEMTLTQGKTRDAWSQANPGETGKWNKEDRRPAIKQK